MATITQHAPGTFSWPELSTSDYQAAKKFYAALFGWGVTESPMGEGEVYGRLQVNGVDVAAAYKMQAKEASAGIPPHWNSYVTVKSADETAAKAKTLGGTVVAEPFDVFDFGRMAVIQDPTGAIFCLWEARKHTGAGILGETGSLCWTELMTSDAAKATAFYTALFGWTTEVFPMGPNSYTVFKRGTESAGGMMQMTAEMKGMPSHWTPYFEVADCDASFARAKAAGAKDIMPPTTVPMAGRFAIICDPQGAAFGIIKSNPKS